ncbi:TPA: hypothetical protein HA246_04865 [Candidatus Woesearchaeota archaeon]|nr:hypothetical protein [Candidatus Woesearchaeota archaeon]
MKQNTLLAKLKKEAKDAYKKNTEIIDILLYGSFIKGKTIPSDIDIIILFNRTIDRDVLKSYKPIIKIYKDFFESFPSESILSEGYSLISDKTLAELYKMKAAYLFRYSLKNKNKSKRMQFYYALYGRNTKGVMEATNSKKFSNETILTPIEYTEVIKEFFEINHVEYFYLPILYPMTYSNAERLNVS